MNTFRDRKLCFPLSRNSQKLKDLVALMGSDYGKSKNTYLMHHENDYLRFYLDSSVTLKDSSSYKVKKSEGQVISFKVAQLNLEQIRVLLGLYNNSRFLNCSTKFALKDKALIIIITPLDEKCDEMLSHIEGNI